MFLSITVTKIKQIHIFFIYLQTDWGMNNKMVLITLPKATIYDTDILNYVDLLHLPDFVGVKMRDELSINSRPQECGILNLEPHTEEGSH